MLHVLYTVNNDVLGVISLIAACTVYSYNDVLGVISLIAACTVYS